MAKLWVMVGVPGSGKSTYLSTHNTPNSIIVSRDKIRYSLVSEEEPYFSKEKEVYKQFIKEIAEALAKKNIDYVFVDQTSLDERARAKLINALLGCGAHYDELNAIVFNLPISRIIKQNAQRKGRECVSIDALSNMYNKFTIPTKKEGFNNIYIYNGKDWYYGK